MLMRSQSRPQRCTSVLLDATSGRDNHVKNEATWYQSSIESACCAISAGLRDAIERSSERRNPGRAGLEEEMTPNLARY